MLPGGVPDRIRITWDILHDTQKVKPQRVPRAWILFPPDFWGRVQRPGQGDTPYMLLFWEASGCGEIHSSLVDLMRQCMPKMERTNEETMARSLPSIYGARLRHMVYDSAKTMF